MNDFSNTSTEVLKSTIKQAEEHAAVYKGCKDGSYDACLAQYNYWAVKQELQRRTKRTP